MAGRTCKVIKTIKQCINPEKDISLVKQFPSISTKVLSYTYNYKAHF